MRHLAAFWLLAAFTFSTAPSCAAVFISGRIFVRGTHAPVAGATVSLYPLNDFQPADTGLSLQNGAFVLKAPVPGKYRLTVDGSECRPTQVVITVPAGGIPSLDIDVVQDAPLRIRLVGPDGAPVTVGQAEAWGSISWGGGGGALNPVTKKPSTDGVVEMPAPRGAPLDAVSAVVVAVRDPEVGCGQTHLSGWPDAPVTVYLERGATLSGTVLNAAGAPAPDVSVTITRIASSPTETAPGFGGNSFRMPFDGPQLFFPFQQMVPTPRGRVVTNTGEDGRFVVPALFYSEYTVVAEIPGVGARSRVVSLSAAAATVSIGPDDQAWPPARVFGFPNGPGLQRPVPGFRDPFEKIPRFIPSPFMLGPEIPEGVPLPWRQRRPRPARPGAPQSAALLTRAWLARS